MNMTLLIVEMAIGLSLVVSECGAQVQTFCTHIGDNFSCTNYDGSGRKGRQGT